MLEGNHVLILLGFQPPVLNLKEDEAQKRIGAAWDGVSHVGSVGPMHHNLLT